MERNINDRRIYPVEMDFSNFFHYSAELDWVSIRSVSTGNTISVRKSRVDFNPEVKSGAKETFRNLVPRQDEGLTYCTRLTKTQMEELLYLSRL